MLEYHRELLADGVRTQALRKAVLATVRPGDVVVDIGCGTGVLSFFACEAGAARVYAIDETHAADAAQLLARHLGVADRVTVLHGRSTAVTLPERADVLVTETMGAAAFDEGILGSVLDARARFLRPDARILPRSLTLMLAPVEDAGFYEQRIGWWSREQHGLDLSPLRLFASSSLLFASPAEESLLAPAASAITVDLTAFDSPAVGGQATFESRRDGLLHGFACWFHADLAGSIELSSRGASSWRCGFLPLEEPIAVQRGTRVEASLQTDDGRVWGWRGTAGDSRFDQTTWLAVPPCIAPAL